MTFWTSLSPAIRGFIRGLGIMVLFSVLDYVAQNIGTTGWVSPTVAGLITAIIGAIENKKTNVAMASLK